MKKYISLIIGAICLVFASCNFDSKNEVQYKVLHMQQNIENDDYTIFEEEVFTASIGSKIKILQKDYEGFTALSVEQQIVKDGLTVPVYYDRKLIKFDFNLAGGTGIETITKKFGTSTNNIQIPVKGTTRFTGWEPALPDTFNKDSTFTATWNYPCYKVQYLFENADDEGYSLDENFPEQTFAGIGGTMTSVEAPEITGFTPQAIEQIAIHELAENEEIPVVTVKYNRNLITLFIDLNEGLGESYVRGKFGQTLNLEKLPQPARPKYEFVKYEFTDSSYFFETFALELNNKKVLRAVWKGEGQARYVIRVFAQNIDDEEYSEIGKYIAVGDSDSESKLQFEYTEKSNEHKLEVKSDSSVVTTFLDSYIPAAKRPIENKKISGDETTRVDVYVDRLEYVYKFEYGKPDEKYQETDGNNLIVRGKYGQEVTIPDFYKEGYSRNGTDWKSKTPPEIFSGSSVEYTYTVNWKANNYTVHFDKNYSGATGSHGDMSCVYDSYSDLPTYMNMKIYRPGFFIKEWNTKPDGSGYAIDYIRAWENPTYSNILFRNLTSESEGEVTLYAQWEEIQLKKIEILGFDYSYRSGDKYSANVKIDVPLESRVSTKYYCRGLGSNHIPGVDAATPLLVYLNGELLQIIPFSDLTIAYSATNRDKLLQNIYFEMKPSYSYTMELKLGFPIKDDPQTSEDYHTNTSSVAGTFHSSSTAKPSDLRVVDIDNGTMTVKWTNPDAQEIKSVTIDFDKSYSIENLTPGAEVEYTLTGLQPGGDYQLKVTTVDGFDGSATCWGGYYKIPDFTTTDAQKGQIYYSDKTWSWKYDSTKTPVGLIFSVTDEGKPEKIFALEQAKKAARTSVISKNLKDVNSTDGSENWSKLKSVDTSATLDQYPAFKYCSEYKVTAIPALTWYLPSSSELYDISHKSNNSGSAFSAQVDILKEQKVMSEDFTYGGYHWSSTGDDYGSSRFRYSNGTYIYSNSTYDDKMVCTAECYALPVAKVPQ